MPLKQKYNLVFKYINTVMYFWEVGLLNFKHTWKKLYSDFVVCTYGKVLANIWRGVLVPDRLLVLIVMTPAYLQLVHLGKTVTVIISKG